MAAFSSNTEIGNFLSNYGKCLANLFMDAILTYYTSGCMPVQISEHRIIEE